MGGGSTGNGKSVRDFDREGGGVLPRVPEVVWGLGEKPKLGVAFAADRMKDCSGVLLARGGDWEISEQEIEGCEAALIH